MISHRFPSKFDVVKASNKRGYGIYDYQQAWWREANIDQRKVPKGLRWLLYRHSLTRTQETHAHSRRLRKQITEFIVPGVKDEFERFWEYSATWAAERFLKGWTPRALRSRLDPLLRFQLNLVKFIVKSIRG
ncbi:MAG: hypothetical protein P8163_18600 [Candidatus Thiodiazotropha sp.]